MPPTMAEPMEKVLHQEASDADLMAQVRAGDREAFADLVDRHKDAVVNYLTRLTGNRDRAEDLGQETFLRLYRSAAGYVEQGYLRAYLFRIATNLVRSEERRERRQRLLLPLLGGDPDRSEPLAALRPAAPGAAARARGRRGPPAAALPGAAGAARDRRLVVRRRRRRARLPRGHHQVAHPPWTPVAEAAARVVLVLEVFRHGRGKIDPSPARAAARDGVGGFTARVLRRLDEPAPPAASRSRRPACGCLAALASLMVATATVAALGISVGVSVGVLQRERPPVPLAAGLAPAMPLAAAHPRRAGRRPAPAAAILPASPMDRHLRRGMSSAPPSCGRRARRPRRRGPAGRPASPGRQRRRSACAQAHLLLRELQLERGRLERELRSLRRPGSGAPPTVLYLGGDENYDLVLSTGRTAPRDRRRRARRRRELQLPLSGIEAGDRRSVRGGRSRAMHHPFHPARPILALAALLLACGAAVSLPAAAQLAADPPADRHADKSKLICIGEDGEEKVIEGTGTLAKRGYLGVELSELTPELRAHFGAPQSAGVMVARVTPGSPADKAGLQLGDIITSLAGKPVDSSWDVRSRVRPLGEGAVVALEVWRDGRSQAMTATVAQKERREIDLSPFLMKGGDAERIMTFRRLPGPAAEGDTLDGAVATRMRLQPRVSQREELLEKKLKALEKRIHELESRLPKQ